MLGPSLAWVCPGPVYLGRRWQFVSDWAGWGLTLITYELINLCLCRGHGSLVQLGQFGTPDTFPVVSYGINCGLSSPPQHLRSLRYQILFCCKMRLVEKAHCKVEEAGKNMMVLEGYVL